MGEEADTANRVPLGVMVAVGVMAMVVVEMRLHLEAVEGTQVSRPHSSPGTNRQAMQFATAY